MAEETTFQIAYEGDALADGSMDVRELAPALMSLSDLVEQANKELHGEEADVTLKIEDTGEGSFEVDLALWAAEAADLLRDPAWEGLSAILGVLGIGGGGTWGLFKLIQSRRGESPESVEDVEGTTRVKITFRDGTVIEMEGAAWRMYLDSSAREKARSVVKPLKQPGITGFRASRNGEETLRVKNTEVTNFDEFDEEPTQIGEEATTQVFSIADISFTPGNKWRLSDGENTFYVDVSDGQFIKKVQNGERRFSTKDYLRVRLVTRQFRTADGLNTEREVTKVIEHIQPHQLDMFDSSKGPDEEPDEPEP